MWKKEYSITLSKICVIIFMLTLIGCVLGGPWLVKWFLSFSHANIQHLFAAFMCSAYATAVPAALALYHLYRLLAQIQNDNAFTAENISHLRGLSWCCIIVAVICAVSTFYYIPFIFIAVAAAFMALILRVIKNVFVQAHAIKTENDYTI